MFDYFTGGIFFTILIFIEFNKLAQQNTEKIFKNLRVICINFFTEYPQMGQKCSGTNSEEFI